MGELAVGEALAPKAPILLLEEALADLEGAISFSAATAAESHTVVIVDGLDNADAPVALGRYLVGALAGAVDVTCAGWRPRWRYTPSSRSTSRRPPFVPVPSWRRKRL